MLQRLRARLTYANVMATIAVFVALGGTSYGIATGTIGSREITNNSVRGKDVRRATLRSSDVRNFSLLAADFAPGQLPQGPQGPRGERGEKGDRGDQGIQGPSGLSGLTRVEAESAENSISSKQVTATCPAGKQLVGTGYDIFGGKVGSSPDHQTDVMMDFVIPGPTSVAAAAYEDEATAANWSVKAIAICATVAP